MTSNDVARRQSAALEPQVGPAQAGGASGLPGEPAYQVGEQGLDGLALLSPCTVRGIVRNGSSRSASGWSLLASVHGGKNTLRIPLAPDGSFSATVDCGKLRLTLTGSRVDEGVMGSWTFALPRDEEIELRVSDDSFETASILLTVDTRGVPNGENGYLELSTSEEQWQFRLGDELEALTLGPLKGGTYFLQLCWSDNQSELRQFLGEFVLHANDVVDAGIVRALHPGYLLVPPELVSDIQLERFQIKDQAGVEDGYAPESLASGKPIELACGVYDLSIRTRGSVIEVGEVRIDEGRTFEWQPHPEDLRKLRNEH